MFHLSAKKQQNIRIDFLRTIAGQLPDGLGKQALLDTLDEVALLPIGKAQRQDLRRGRITAWEFAFDEWRIIVSVSPTEKDPKTLSTLRQTIVQAAKD